jgi:hypothetical protein
MGRTARGGIPLYLQAIWPLVIGRAPFIRRLRAPPLVPTAVRERDLP